MRIAICDDEQVILDQIGLRIKKYCEKHSLSCQLALFASAEGLLNCDKEISMVFLDYEMPKLNGMDAARRLREKTPDMLIVFLTAHPEMMPHAFEVKTFRYLLKPLSEADLEECMNAAGKELAQTKVVLCADDIQKVVSLKKIQYIEAAEKGTSVRTENGIFPSKYTMAQWQQMLISECFYRCHKTYYINLAYVDEIRKDYAVLYNKERVAISRRRRKEFREKLLAYIKQNAR